MKFVEGMILGGLITGAAFMYSNNTMSMKKMKKKFSKFWNM